MNRKEFFKTCGYACLSGVAFVSVLQSCSTSKIINAEISGAEILVNLTDFEINKKGKITYKKYIVIQNSALNYPICIYRFSENEFTALNLQCTHQGAELQVFGDKIVCPAHGSEFNSKGNVESGPALKQLRSFTIKIEKTQLKLSLS